MTSELPLTLNTGKIAQKIGRGIKKIINGPYRKKSERRKRFRVEVE